MRYGLEFGFPDAVEITGFIYDAGIDSCKNGFRSIARFQEFNFQFVVRCQGNPFDVMFFEHRMFYGTNGNFDGISHAFYVRDVFFFSCVDRADSNRRCAFYDTAE